MDFGRQKHAAQGFWIGGRGPPVTCGQQGRQKHAAQAALPAAYDAALYDGPVAATYDVSIVIGMVAAPGFPLRFAAQVTQTASPLLRFWIGATLPSVVGAPTADCGIGKVVWAVV